LTVLADPFWGRLPWQLKRRGGNTASTGNQLAPWQRSCAPEGCTCESVGKPIDGLISNDI